MRKVWIPKAGDPTVLELREAPDPSPGPSEVLVRVEAAGVNFSDLMTRQGINPAYRLPVVPGLEVAGTVEKVGTEVSTVGPGEPVIAVTRAGGYSSHVVVPVESLFPRPENMTPETGAALPVNYLTAFQALVVMGGVRHAQELGGNRMRVLVHGAGGGVGTAAADIARIYAVELFGTASPGKLDYVRSRGYDHAISYRDNDWVKEVREASGGSGMDLILDPRGGAHWKDSIDLLAPTGRIVLFGYASALGRSRASLATDVVRIPWMRFLPFSLINRNLGVAGVQIGNLWEIRDQVAGWMRKLLSYYQRGEIRPHVDRTFLLEEAAAAHEYIQRRENRGKVVLVP
jgi:synaptic vesicle membrane protein VAT-1